MKISKLTYHSFRKVLFIFSLFYIFMLSSCEKERPPVKEIVIGQTTVDLDANKPVLRNNEALLGNIVTDALLENGLAKGMEIDFAMINSGSIRFNSEIRPNGIYPAGDLTNLEVVEMLPFYDYEVFVELTGTQVKSIFERSAAGINRGAFLQVSKEVKLYIDPLKQNQLLDESVFPEQIALEGSRIDSIFVNGVKLLPEAVYNVATSNFLALGGDQNVILYQLDDTKRSYTEDLITDVVEEYIKTYSPVSPAIEGRIIFN